MDGGKHRLSRSRGYTIVYGCNKMHYAIPWAVVAAGRNGHDAIRGHALRLCMTNAILHHRMQRHMTSSNFQNEERECPMKKGHQSF